MTKRRRPTRRKRSKATPPKGRATLRVVTGGRHAASQNVTEQPTPEAKARTLEALGLDELDDVDRAMLAVLEAKPAATDQELATAVGLVRETCNRRKRRRAFQKALEMLRLEALDVFRGNQRKAARRLGELVDSKDEDVAIRASLEHLKPLLRKEDAGGGESGAEAFARLLEDAYSFRERKKAAPQPRGAAVSTPARV